MSLGVIGGLGPMATAYFMELVTDMTKADCDQEHLEMLVYSKPTIPDRTSYIIGKSEENPLPPIVEAGKTLQQLGVECIAIPCITAHYFHEDLQSQIGTEVLHAPRETARILKEGGVKKVGIMATDGTIKSQILQSQIEAQKMEAILPSEEMQRLVMSLIYEDIKAGKKPNMKHFSMVKSYLKSQGAEVIILGCTELSLIKKDIGIGCGFIDVLDVLAKTAILTCGKDVKKEYEKLFETFE